MSTNNGTKTKRLVNSTVGNFLLFILSIFFVLLITIKLYLNSLSICTSIKFISQENVVVFNSVLIRLFLKVILFHKLLTVGLAEIAVKHPAHCNTLMWKFILVSFNTGCDVIAKVRTSGEQL